MAGRLTQARPVCPHPARRVYTTDVRNPLAYDDLNTSYEQTAS
jgi:hypothetical protein